MLTKRSLNVEAIAQRKTNRLRILDAALGLFNKLGPNNVTTAEIAKAAGVAHGNLHYHFSTKADLVAAVFQCAYDKIVRLQTREDTSQAVGRDVTGALLEWFEVMEEHKWIGRDTPGIGLVAPIVEPLLQEFDQRNYRFLKQILAGLEGHELAIFPSDQRERLLTNVLIVATRWNDFRKFGDGAEGVKGREEWGFKQVLALFQPYLTERGKLTVSTRAKGERFLPSSQL